jgi:beta-galactosidase
MVTNLESLVCKINEYWPRWSANSCEVSNLGPQNNYPIPEGILNYNGTNTIGITIWSLDQQGARLGGLLFNPDFPVMSSYQRPTLAPMPSWERRPSSY